MKLRVHTSDPDGGLESALRPGDVVVVETTPGKGVKILVKADGTLRIEVDVEPDDEPCLSLVEDPPA